MANLRDIRTRITSIRNTEQITRAMKMVAAAKLRKAQQRMLATRPYAGKMGELITRLAAGNLKIDNPLLHKTEEIERICLIVIGSDRGLCGALTIISLRLSKLQLLPDTASTSGQENWKSSQLEERLKLILTNAITGWLHLIRDSLTTSAMSFHQS